MEWGVHVRRLRQARGWKQTALADYLGVDQATISRWERGLQVPDLTMRVKLRDLVRRALPDADRMALMPVTASPHMAVAVDNGLRIVAASEPAAERWGVAHRMLPGKSLTPFLSPDLTWALDQIDQAGFWRGEVAVARAVASAEDFDGRAFYGTYVWTPLQLSGGEMLLNCQCREVGINDYIREFRNSRLSITPRPDVPELRHT